MKVFEEYEPQIGEVFNFFGNYYRAVECDETNNCTGCAFDDDLDCKMFCCNHEGRIDGRNVIFKQLTFKEVKELIFKPTKEEIKEVTDYLRLFQRWRRGEVDETKTTDELGLFPVKIGLMIDKAIEILEGIEQ